MSKSNKSNRAKLIANPGASGNTAGLAKKLRFISKKLRKNGIKVDVALAKPKGKATPIARKAVKDGYKIVIALGGDGTVQAVMRGIVDSKTRLGIIPAGMENNISKSLGIPEDLEKACDLIATDTTLKLDMAQVKTKKGKKFIFYGMATIGYSAALSPVATKAAASKLSGIKKSKSPILPQEVKSTIRLTLNDESKLEVDTILVMVSNAPAFGKKVQIAPGASLQDGQLDIAVYPDFSKKELARYHADVMDGGYSGNGKIQQYQTRKLKVKSTPKLVVTADGVALGKGSVTIKVLPAALRVIATGITSDLKNPGSYANAILPETITLTAKKAHAIAM